MPEVADYFYLAYASMPREVQAEAEQSVWCTVQKVAIAVWSLESKYWQRPALCAVAQTFDFLSVAAPTVIGYNVTR
ncbi:hypothetical protein EIP91_002597, partial [Steccherinum ochraceum]